MSLTILTCLLSLLLTTQTTCKDDNKTVKCSDAPQFVSLATQGSYSLEYHIDDQKGKFFASKGRYRIESGSWRIIFDGSVIYVVDYDAKEVSAEKAKIEIPYDKVTLVYDGKEGSGNAYARTSSAGSQDTFPSSIIIDDDKGKKMKIVIDSFAPADSFDESLFTFDLKSCGPEWVITDLTE